MKKEVREYIKIIKYAITFIFVICAVVSMYKICFNPCFNGYYTFTKYPIRYDADGTQSFNPCFNGYYTFTHLMLNKYYQNNRFQSLF